jgi:hypothetical protein
MYTQNATQQKKQTQRNATKKQTQVEDLTNEQRGALLASLPRDLSDAPTFSRAVTDLLADIQYTRMLNATAAATTGVNGSG